MTLPASGSISLGDVAAELGAGLPLSLGDSRVLALAGKGALPISLSDLYGKSSIPPLTANATGGYSSGSSTTSGGTVSTSATASPSGGVAPYSYAWTVVSNTGGATVGSLTGQSVSISKSFGKLSDGSASVTFNVTVSDSQGRSVTVNNVTATIEWSSS
jgi:hypothetical protein